MGRSFRSRSVAGRGRGMGRVTERDREYVGRFSELRHTMQLDGCPLYTMSDAWAGSFIPSAGLRKDFLHMHL